jgi:predicted CXXCH cytochrome family protein
MTLPCLGRRPRWLLVGGLAVLLVFLVVGAASAAQGDNASCLSCHSNAGLNIQLASGEILPLLVTPQRFSGSVHGVAGLTCISCHTNISGYPHPKVTAGDRRSFQLERYTQCRTCHEKQYKDTLDSNHAHVLASGDRQAAICTDCHGSHDISKPNQPRQKISATCQKCHSKVYEQYAGSIHGKALAATSNPDVPVCTDCHGTHRQEDPTTAAFRLKSPDICGKCHADAALMKRYNISTDVFNTYVADFHGTTVKLFEKQHPDQPTNKAICTDCHGIHDIKTVTDANATVVKENLLTTCRRCHPDATANFPDSWVGHFQPSANRYALVYYVNLFYRILIPAVIGGMALFVMLDAARRVYNRFRRPRAA